MTICDTFLRTAISTWDKISEGRTVGYQLKEETITDLNILELKKRLGTRVLTIPFNKFDEGKNGADWEWWFRDIHGFWIGVRVQAKIIDIKTDGFEHLHYKKLKKYQSEKIITEALTSTPPRIPLYSLYTQWDDRTVLANWTCSFPRYVDLYGCSIMSAFDVYKRRLTDTKDLKSLLVDMRPWHCLVCCKGFSPSGQLTERIESYVKNSFFQGIDDSLKALDIILPDTFRTKNPPDYVEKFINQKITVENVNVPESLDGLLIYLDEE